MLTPRPWQLDLDYPILINWWKQWEFGVVPKECLPPEGIIVEHNNTPICATGLYVGEGTKFGFMEWVVVDKLAQPKVTHKAITLCINSIIDLAKQKQLKLLYTVTGAEGLHKRYTKYHGMHLLENNTKTFLCNLTDAPIDLEAFSEY